MQLSTFKSCLAVLGILLILAPTVTSRVFTKAGEGQTSESTYRAMVYKQTDARIQQLNELYSEYFTSGHNQFSHYTTQQFVELFTGGRMSEKGSLSRTFVEGPTYDQKSSLRSQQKNEEDAMFEDIKANSGGYLNSVIPTVFSIDYSSSDNLCITNVKNQGSCGSCWAFAGVAELESYFMKYHKLLLDLSEQQMVDCLPAVQPNNAGCNGGQLDSVGYYSVLYPIAQEKYYRYTAVQGTCNQSKISEGPTFGIKSYVYVYDCVSLTDALLTLKPIGICAAIDTKWQNYISGVIANCNDAIVGGHCVLLVGATSDGTNAVNTNYWKIKNSWGTTFGEAGFMRLYKDNTDLTNGFCGLCTSAIYSV